jgi:hypothetical protein
MGVSVFSPEWQSQRQSPEKRCPDCKSQVEAVFGGLAFFGSLLLVFAPTAFLVYLFPSAAKWIWGVAFPLGLGVAFFSSLRLRVPSKSSKAPGS